MILEKTGDASELVDWALEVWRDKDRPHAERAAAHAWLSDRCLGRPMASAELTVHAGDGTPQLDGARLLGRLSDRALAELADAHEQLALESGEDATETP